MSAGRVVFLFFLLAVSISSKEIMVIEYCRHGARGSLADLHDGSQWIKKWGVEQLTGNGMRMQYYLGKAMRTKYPAIFDSTFSVNHMEAYATNFNRTIASGLSQFTGLFDMFKGPEVPFSHDDKRLQPPVQLTVNTDVGFKTALPQGYTPIPITSKLNQRKMQIIRDDCPYGNQKALDAKKKLSEFIMKQPKVKDLLERGAKKYGITDISDINFKATGERTTDIDTLFFLGDFTIQDYLHNKHPTISKDGEPGEGGNPLYDQLETAYSLATLARFNDTEFTRNVISEVLFEIKAAFHNKMTNKSYDKRFILYSGHDDMLTAILQASGHLDAKCLIERLMSGDSRKCTNTPDLAASMVWELHEEGEGEKVQHYIKVKYNSKYIDFCALYNEADGYKCSYQEFSSRLELIANRDFRDWCYAGDDKRRAEAIELEWKIITWSMLILLVLLFLGFGFTIYKLQENISKMKQERDYPSQSEAYMSMEKKETLQ